MIENVALNFVLDLLRNSSTITNIVGTNGVRFPTEELPANLPVLEVSDPSGESDEQFSDKTLFRIEAFENSRTLVWALASTVDDVLNIRADTSSLDQSIRVSHTGIRIHSIFKLNSLGQTLPTKDGNTIYSVILNYELRGKQI